MKLRKSIRKRIRYLNTKAGNDVAMDPALRRKLMIVTKPEVERLSKMLERDLLRLWNYEP